MSALTRNAAPGLGLSLCLLMVAVPAAAGDDEDLRALAERLRADGAAIPAADAPVAPVPLSEEAAPTQAEAPADGELARLQALAERAGSWTRERPPQGFSATARLGTDQAFEALFPMPPSERPMPEASAPGAPGTDLPPCDPSREGTD